MPPHRLRRLSPYINFQFVSRIAKYLLVLSSLALAGCATTQGPQYAEADATPSRLVRDNYLSYTQSDPLGAYLSSRDIDYPMSESRNGNVSNKTMVSTALSMLGTKYRFGGETPNAGFDCSGLVIYAAEKSLGLKLPRQSADLAHEGIAVKSSELKRGDLVFFNTRGHRYSHVGIYLGDQKFVHAPRSGSVVRIESLETSYWKKRYNGARRLASASTTNPEFSARN